jgi:tRNA wybutosine-synthesizing protein 2
MIESAFIAVRVPKKDAEKVRRYAESIGAKDKTRLITVEGDNVIIPILKGFEEQFSNYQIIEQQNPHFIKERDLYTLLAKKIPEKLRKFIPRSYKIIGDIILVKIPEEISEYTQLIGQTLLEIHPRCRSVWRDMGKSGMLRKPNLTPIAGDSDKSETVQMENGCLFKLDVTKVMFSPGNLHERLRIGKIVEEGEVVVDMFAGIGYFSIPIAKHSQPERVYSIELNPDSYYYLLENIKLNRVREIVPVLGDSMYVTPEGVADRVIMGHIYCHEFLQVAIKALNGKGYIHYHESVPLAVIDRPVKRVEKAAAASGKKVKVKFRKVKNYSPGVVHAVVDAFVYE